jgi:hypothetical protein
VSPSTHAHAADNDGMHACTYAHKSCVVIKACTQGDNDIAHVISVMYQINKVFLKQNLVISVETPLWVGVFEG